MFDPKILATWFLIFMIYSFGGWAMEVIISLFNHKKFINRGFLVGPICPIYGTGAVLLSVLIKPDESPLVVFCVAMVGGAILEYSASYLMEKMFRVRWWDYSEKAFNVNGRICFSSVLSFGLGGILILKVITPMMLGMINSWPIQVTYIVALLLLAWTLCDIALSLWLMLGVRVTVGTVSRDATDEISERVREILMDKGKFNQRLVKAFPNQTPSKKPVRTRSKSRPKT